jgi:hypothetical protein
MRLNATLVATAQGVRCSGDSLADTQDYTAYTSVVQVSVLPKQIEHVYLSSNVLTRMCMQDVCNVLLLALL